VRGSWTRRGGEEEERVLLGRACPEGGYLYTQHLNMVEGGGGREEQP